jgi:hypothetical protein
MCATCHAHLFVVNFDHHKNIWRVQIVKFIIMQLFSPACYVLSEISLRVRHTLSTESCGRKKVFLFSATFPVPFMCGKQNLILMESVYDEAPQNVF